MDNRIVDVNALLERIERVEKKNLFFKRVGSLFLIIVGTFFLLGQAKKNNFIEAEKFVLKDTAGNVRAELTFLGSEPALRFYNINHQLTSSFSDGQINLKGRVFAKDNVIVMDERDQELILTSSGLTASRISEDGKKQFTFILGSSSGKPPIGVSSLAIDNKATSHLMLFSNKGKIELTTSKEETAISTQDSEGYRTILGNVELVTSKTGESHKTSAASVLMFDKNGKVVWRAP